LRLIWGTVIELSQQEGSQRADYSELVVSVDGREGEALAICYPDLVGEIAAGQRVLLNTTAVDLDLGTGGKHFVVASDRGAVEAGDNSAQPQVDYAMDQSAGHLMKLRYTPHQLNVLSVEAQESPYHKIMETRDSLEGVPVVCCGLHSQVPLVAAAIKKAMPSLIVGYVMDDAASLALPLSKVLAQSVDAGLIDLTVSTGQAFGGEIEAINLHSGLLAAVHVGGCDVVITAVGPGIAGTGTPFGHGGVAQGEAINAAASLGGAAIACLRMSQADQRERHLGISHHSLTALARIALAPATIAIPHLDENCPVSETVEHEINELPNQVGHVAIQLDEPFYDPEALMGVKVKTMGRDYDQDPIFFEAAAAAGAVAAMMAVMTIEEEAATALEDSEAAATAVAAVETMGGCAGSQQGPVSDGQTPPAHLVGGCPSAATCGSACSLKDEA